MCFHYIYIYITTVDWQSPLFCGNILPSSEEHKSKLQLIIIHSTLKEQEHLNHYLENCRTLLQSICFKIAKKANKEF